MGAVILALGVLLHAPPVLGQRRAAPAGKAPAELAADVANAMQQYRDAVARSLPTHEANVQEAAAALDERRMLHRAGALPDEYVQEAERGLAAAQRELAEAHAALAEADRIAFEAMLQQRLAALAPLPRGGFEDLATLVRFNGIAPWSLKNVPALGERFAAVFGRSLPVSAYGQTSVHDRLSLDHRSAIDVAVHPDSPEGRWLMQYLRAAGIPFIGIRAMVPGTSTGAHIHVGPPSVRMIAR
jgi:hypothetical protein